MRPVQLRIVLWRLGLGRQQDGRLMQLLCPGGLVVHRNGLGHGNVRVVQHAWLFARRIVIIVAVELGHDVVLFFSVVVVDAVVGTTNLCRGRSR